jgi:hypothetical protein
MLLIALVGATRPIMNGLLKPFGTIMEKSLSLSKDPVASTTSIANGNTPVSD